MDFRAEMKTDSRTLAVTYRLAVDVAIWTVENVWNNDPAKAHLNGNYVRETFGDKRKTFGPIAAEDLRSWLANRQELVLSTLETMEIKP